MAKKNTPEVPGELLDQVLAGRDLPTVLESDSLIGDLKKALDDRMLNAEDVHLSKEAEAGISNHPMAPVPRRCNAPRASSSCRDPHSRFDPALIRQYCRRFPGVR